MNISDYYMNEVNEVLDRLEKYEGCKIVNKTKDDYILFDTPFKQPFPFDIMIEYNCIVGQESFNLNIPALIIKKHDLAYFSNTVSKLTQYIDKLNTEIGMYRMSKRHLKTK